MFRKAADFEAFERVMVEAHQREPILLILHSSHGHVVRVSHETLESWLSACPENRSVRS
jgi:hypothetical protein